MMRIDAVNRREDDRPEAPNCRLWQQPLTLTAARITAGSLNDNGMAMKTEIVAF